MSYSELYDMTIKELRNTLEKLKLGMSYRMWKEAVIIARMFSKEPFETPEKASPELYPPVKVVGDYSFLKDKNKRKGEVK